MNADKLSLESLARRVELLEQVLQTHFPAPAKDWRRVVGMFDDSAIMPEIIAEGFAIREADRVMSREDVLE